MLFDLLGDQVALGDVQLLVARVTRQLEDLQAVLEGRRDGIDLVGRGEEQHLGQIKRHLQEVVAEHVVLLGVRHLQKSRGGIAAEVVSQLVDLVQHEHRVASPRPLDALEDAAGQRPDIGAAVAADLSFVPHPTQGRAHEVAPQGPGHAPAGGGLAHAGRAHQTEDGALLVRLELAHRQVLDDALFDLLQPVVVLVQDPTGAIQVQVVLGGLVPGELHQPLQIGARHRILGGLGRDLPQPHELFVGHLLGLGGHFSLEDALLELARLVVLLTVPQLILDGPHALPQHGLPLVPAHLGPHMRVDVLPDLVRLQGAMEPEQHLPQALGHVHLVEDLHLLGQGGVDVGGRNVGERAGLPHLLQQRGRLVGDVGRDGDQLLAGVAHRQGQALGLHVLQPGLLDHLEGAPEDVIHLFERKQPQPAHSPGHEGRARGGDLHHLERFSLHSHGEHVGDFGVFHLGESLRDKCQLVLFRVGDQLGHGQGFGSTHVDGHHHPREEDRVSQGDYWQPYDIFWHELSTIIICSRSTRLPSTDSKVHNVVTNSQESTGSSAL